ncbi:MAG: hypothetical protein L6Q97_05020 [Thermoanaerobaculia bacterium]|nr:hypothetical protein [Thermoanaerobaculia bacterium]
MKLVFPISILFLTAAACAPRLSTERFVLPPATAVPQTEPLPGQRAPARPVANACAGWEGHLPDPEHPEYLPMRYLRINFHVMDKTDSTAHRPADSVRVFLHELVERSNEDLAINERNWRSPEGTRVLPKGYRYVLTPRPVAGDEGIYFHYDDDLYYFVSMGKYQNNYDRKVIQKYAIGADTILNIFLQVHPRDSFGSKTYRPNGQGIALGTALKMAGVLESSEGPESFDGLLNHEVGHILGISHAWVEDGCPDTENHPNKCWTGSKDPPCRDQATNNMMDYNAYQLALTPCQIGRAQATFANEKSAVRRCLIPTWCSLREDRAVVIADSVAWTGARDLEGHLTVAPGGVLRLSCRVSLPPGGRITVQPGGQLWLDGCRLHNACGKTWEGIFVQEQNSVRGEVRILRQPMLEHVADHPKRNRNKR